MKYVKQFGIILLISFAGEALNYLLPPPVPASIYGLVLMFLCLQLRVFRLEDFAYLAIAVITTVLVMVVSGRVTQFFLRRGKEV